MLPTHLFVTLACSFPVSLHVLHPAPKPDSFIVSPQVSGRSTTHAQPSMGAWRSHWDRAFTVQDARVGAGSIFVVLTKWFYSQLDAISCLSWEMSPCFTSKSAPAPAQGDTGPTDVGSSDGGGCTRGCFIDINVVLSYRKLILQKSCLRGRSLHESLPPLLLC